MKRSYLICVLTFFLWGSVYVFSKYAMACFSPMTVQTLRYILASLFLFAVAPKKQFRRIQREHIKYFLITALLGYLVANGMTMYSIHMLDATVASLINSSNPVFIMLFATLLLKERMTVRRGVGIGCALIGVVFVIGIDFGHISLPGIVCSVLGVVLGALGSAVVRKVSTYYVPEQVTLFYLLAALPFCIICSIVETVRNPLPLTLPGIGSILYLGIITTGVANLLWNKSLTAMDASVCSMFYPLQPMFSALFSVILLGEQITVELIVGGVLIAIGVLVGLGFPGHIRQRKQLKNNPQ